MSTFRIGFAGRVIVYVGGPQPPDEAGWDAYVAAVREHVKKHPKAVFMVWSGAARPSSAQRQALLDATPKDVPAAVIIESAVARGVVTAFSWFMSTIKPFSPDALDKAYDYLGLDAGERTQVAAECTRLRDELKKSA